MSARGSRWHENAVVYAVDVEVFQDADGDGAGDFRGLIDRLDYLDRLGVDCLWLLPFYPSPNRDNGYDVADYYGVDPRHGSLGDFVEFVREAEARGIDVLIDLVANHTSDQHPWFQRAREDLDSKYRDYYVWSDDPPEPDPERGSVFPGEPGGDRVWTYDSEAGAYYFHRFYEFQPDLNLQNPDVVEEVEKVVSFWLQLGVSGFRIDAATLMIQEKRPGHDPPDDPHALLRTLKTRARQHRGDVVFLAEADDDPSELGDYFGRGDEMDLLLNFYLDAHLFLALASGRGEPVERALATLPEPPAGCGWANFLRNYDELNVGRLPPEEREVVYERFAPDEGSRIYDRGTRRRLAPMLEGDRRWIELAFSLLFSMPGTPLFVYGDEIGMGEDLTLPGRSSVRTPMQWSPTENGGFSTAPAEDLVRPVIDEGRYSTERVNVADQWTDPSSVLSAVQQMIGTRHETPEIARGDLTVLDTEVESVFAHRYDAGDSTVAMAHNLVDEPRSVDLDLDAEGVTVLDLLGDDGDRHVDDGRLEIDLDGYGYRWLRVGRE